MTKEDFLEISKTLPRQPGIYQFIDKALLVLKNERYQFRLFAVMCDHRNSHGVKM